MKINQAEVWDPNPQGTPLEPPSLSCPRNNQIATLLLDATCVAWKPDAGYSHRELEKNTQGFGRPRAAKVMALVGIAAASILWLGARHKRRHREQRPHGYRVASELGKSC